MITAPTFSPSGQAVLSANTVGVAPCLPGDLGSESPAPIARITGRHGHLRIIPFPSAAASGPSGRTTSPAAAAPAPSPFLPGSGAGQSIASVIAERLQQVERWGHTPESDAGRRFDAFMVDLQRATIGAYEAHQFRQERRILRRKLVKLAALTLATIDRLDMEEDV